MKHIIKLTLITLLAVNCINAQWKWGKNQIKGNGKVVTVTRTTKDYDIIKCAGSMDFKLVSGEEGNIELKGDSNLLEYIETTVTNNTLKIKLKEGINLSYKNKPILITIPFKHINAVSLSGSGDLKNEAIIKADDLSVALAGSGDMIINADSINLNTNLSGSGDITLTGQTTNLNAKLAGSGDIHGFNLQSNNTKASVAGSGDIEITSNSKLQARVSGSGDIEYKGNPAQIDNKVTGSGDISKY